MAKAKRNWKAVRAVHLLQAFELCIEFARVERNRSIERIAELMGLCGCSTLYKWLGNGRMPAALIPTFEHACGDCHFVTDYLALSAGRLVIDIPAGKPADASAINAMQMDFGYATGLLIDFYNGCAKADETLAALTVLMVGVAGQRANVLKSATPELLFDGEE